MSLQAHRSHLRAFLEDPKGVSAIVPTSSAVIQRIASKVAPERAGLIVEYGPGSGVLTRALLERLPSTGRLVAIEANEGLADRLVSGIDDPRLAVVRDSAERVLGILRELELGPADFVFSGIPFTWIAPKTARSLVADTRDALATGGRFVTYQTFYQGRRHLRVYLDEFFSSVRSELDLRNLPPYRIHEAVR